MIATWRAVAIAAGLAVVLAVVLAIDLGRSRGVADRALVPGFDPDRATELVWDRPGQPALRVMRAAASPGGAAWRIAASASDGGIPADPGAISDVLAAVRGARWHRRGEPTATHATVTVSAGGERHVIGLGAPLTGTDQRWLVVDGAGVLVDSWVARALDRDPLALRIGAPLAGVRAAQVITIDGAPAGQALRLEGDPRRLTAPAHLVIAAELAAELERALGDVTVVRIPDGPSRAHGFTIELIEPGGGSGTPGGTTRLVIGGSCPGMPALVAVAGTTGDGCIAAASADAVAHAIAALRQPPGSLVEHRPIPFEPIAIQLADGAKLDPVGERIGDAAAEPDRIAELLAALAAPAEVVALPASPATGHLVVTGRDRAELTLDLFAGQLVARRGEPRALRPGTGAWQLLVRPARALRVLTPWIEEPTTITGVQIDGVRYQRGAVIGAWTRAPAGSGSGSAAAPVADPAALEALVAQLAAPHALGTVDDPIAIVHRVTLAITPPTGAPSEHVLALGAPRAAGCPVQLGGDAIWLAPAVCAQVAALAR